MRTILAIVVIVLFSLPGIFAGAPQLAPDAFTSTVAGIPLSILLMSLLMAVFIVLAGVCSGAAARSGALRSRDH